jgi:hypothetical protein
MTVEANRQERCKNSELAAANRQSTHTHNNRLWDLIRGWVIQVSQV